MREQFYWLNDYSVNFLKQGYLLEGVNPLDRIRQIGDIVEERKGLKGYSDIFYEYMGKGWISLSSPVWANFGLERGLPISCFNTYVADNTAEILRGGAEVGMMNKYGGGTSGYFGDIRPRGSSISDGGISNGVIPFLDIYENVTNTISQGRTRRGSFAAYLPINHGDIEEFLTLRSEDSKVKEMSFGVTVPYGWMQSMIDGDKEKRKLWAKVLEKRSETGYPYILFEDNVNNHKPVVYKDKHIKINASNLCTEIMLPSNNEESFVCCLSSVNLLWYDEWKDTNLVEIVLTLLDCVMEEFIEKASKIPFFNKAVSFAQNHNAIGLGVLGLHSYLQSQNIPLEGLKVKMKLNEIFRNIKAKADEASELASKLWGEVPITKGYNERWATKLAIAPTTSSAMILGQVSQSIEPYDSNYYIKDTAKGKIPIKNPYLEKVLEEKGKNTDAVWEDILSRAGSVQHLTFLNDEEKALFKTFGELSQLELVQNVAIIQKYIDQGISFNVKIHPETPVKDINKLYIEAWRLGLKSLYYQRGTNAAQELNRNLLNCVSCES